MTNVNKIYYKNSVIMLQKGCLGRNIYRCGKKCLIICTLGATIEIQIQ